MLTLSGLKPAVAEPMLAATPPSTKTKIPQQAAVFDDLNGFLSNLGSSAHLRAISPSTQPAHLNDFPLMVFRDDVESSWSSWLCASTDRLPPPDQKDLEQ
jgi:hypothetical protein